MKSKYMTIPFPYDCHKFIQCTGDEFGAVTTLLNGNVYEPSTGYSVKSTELPCSIDSKGNVQRWRVGTT